MIGEVCLETEPECIYLGSLSEIPDALSLVEKLGSMVVEKGSLLVTQMIMESA